MALQLVCLFEGQPKRAAVVARPKQHDIDAPVGLARKEIARVRTTGEARRLPRFLPRNHASFEAVYDAVGNGLIDAGSVRGLRFLHRPWLLVGFCFCTSALNAACTCRTPPGEGGGSKRKGLRAQLFGGTAQRGSQNPKGKWPWRARSGQSPLAKACQPHSCASAHRFSRVALRQEQAAVVGGGRRGTRLETGRVPPPPRRADLNRLLNGIAGGGLISPEFAIRFIEITLSGKTKPCQRDFHGSDSGADVRP